MMKNDPRHSQIMVISDTNHTMHVKIDVLQTYNTVNRLLQLTLIQPTDDSLPTIS